MASIDRIIYLQGFFRAYGINKEAGLNPSRRQKQDTGLLLPGDIDASHLGDFVPEGDVDFEDPDTRDKITEHWDPRINFFGQPANPGLIPRATEIAFEGMLPHMPKIPLVPFDVKKYLTEKYQKERAAKFADVLKRMQGGDWSGVKNLWGSGTPATRNAIAVEANKLLNTNREKAKAEAKSKMMKGLGLAGGLALAAGGTALAFMGQKPDTPVSNNIDPNVEELYQHYRARQPDAIYSLTDPLGGTAQTTERAAWGQSTGHRTPNFVRAAGFAGKKFLQRFAARFPAPATKSEAPKSKAVIGGIDVRGIGPTTGPRELQGRGTS